MLAVKTAMVMTDPFIQTIATMRPDNVCGLKSPV
jgi:hypothetical protein